MPWLGRRIGIGNAGAVSRVLLGVTVVLMGVLGGVVGVIAVYLVCYGTHGVMGAAHSTLLHRNGQDAVLPNARLPGKLLRAGKAA